MLVVDVVVDDVVEVVDDVVEVVVVVVVVVVDDDVDNDVVARDGRFPPAIVGFPTPSVAGASLCSTVVFGVLAIVTVAFVLLSVNFVPCARRFADMLPRLVASAQLPRWKQRMTRAWQWPRQRWQCWRWYQRCRRKEGRKTKKPRRRRKGGEPPRKEASRSMGRDGVGIVPRIDCETLLPRGYL